jgi:hypothetical protein
MLPLRRLSRIAVALTFAAGVAAACDVTAKDATLDGDGGIDGGTLDKATCPADEPSAELVCTVPQGTTCAFGTCGTRIARCERGRWAFALNPPPRPPCPMAPPAEGDPCPVCWPGGNCTYFAESCVSGDAGDGGAVPKTAVAACRDSRWALAFFPCLDSGADVQGDGGPDAD